MELIQLFGWLAEQEQKTQDQDKLVKLTEIIDQNNKLFDSRLDALTVHQNTIEMQLTVMIVMLVLVAFVLAYAIWQNERKVKKLTARIIDLEKSSKKVIDSND